MMTWLGRWRSSAAWIAASVALALALFGVFLWVNGRNPFVVYGSMLRGAFGGAWELSETLVEATPIMICALAVALPARAGLLNIGGEGQLQAGALGATYVALFCPAIPHPFVLPAMAVAGAIAGALFASIPGTLRGWLRINETLVSLLLNYVGILLVEYFVHGPWRDPASYGWPFTAQFGSAAVLAPIFPRSRLNVGLLVALALALALHFVFSFTRQGFIWRILGANPRVARYAQVNTAAYVFLCFAVAGSFAGIAGFVECSALQGRLRPGISPGYGYIGFLVAWLAGNSFLTIPVVSILVGGILAAGDNLQIGASLPSDTAEILQGLVFLAVLAGMAMHKNRGNSAV